MTDERRLLLEQHGRLYGEHGLAITFTECLPGGRGDPKRVRIEGWQHTRPLPDAGYGAGLLGNRGMGRNPAIVLRASNLIGLECDSETDLARILALDLPTTVTARSSAPHKRHFYFRPPADLETLPYVAFRFELGKVTADAGRYFVAPPAIHPTGAVYSFLPGLGVGESEFAVLPAATYRALAAQAKTEDSAQKTTLRADPDAKILEGNRRGTVFRFACMLRRWTASRELILNTCLAWNLTHCAPPLEPGQVALQVDGAMRMRGGQELTAREAQRAG